MSHRGLATTRAERTVAGSFPLEARQTQRHPHTRPPQCGTPISEPSQRTDRTCTAAREQSRSFPTQKLPKSKAGFMLFLIY